MNLRSIDLNLLVVLDALLDEAHVSRAAERVGLSQPAASSALDRCRHLFNDRLLERGRGQMRLTAKAQSLQQPIRDLLAQMTALLDPPQPDLGTLRQTVRVVTAELPPTLLAGGLYSQLARTAPGITLALMPWRGAPEALEGLARGHADLAVSVFPSVERDFTRKELLRERYVVAMRKGHPAVQGFDLDRWLAYPHVLVSGRGETFGALDEALSLLGRKRHVGMVVPSFLIVPPLLLDSNLIALLPSRTLPQDAGEHYSLLEPPIPVAGFPLHVAWHRRSDRDSAVQHVAGLIESLLSD
ncbi:putative transcriptional regulatory protein, LysR-family [Bosea sp. LC85]|uniref:LysR family transcriptional regulator n=1 Tax=Bosea sp. LC85 TaxID=1502851 RepID=UPI0004E366AB|nr:LysR family transcriptional regulator [Bosea sp. LC85]KFC73363.1 putative transcriptional regulatory protein, LysR-family [Bosea sp. LC85]